MLKIQGQSMLIPFKYERLPKFCFQCGVIKHGASGCSARSTGRKQNALTEFGMWLHATSPNRTFVGKLGQNLKRREYTTCGNGGEPGRNEYDRRKSPIRRRPTRSSPERGGVQPRTAEHGVPSF
jgi:hypothetical protein